MNGTANHTAYGRNTGTGMENLTLAVAKGRVLKETLPLLERAGIQVLEDPFTSRKLILPTSLVHLSLVVVRSTDVPTYVRFGAADLGVVGKDILVEYDGAGLYELLDLGIARCRMAVAEPAMKPHSVHRRLRIATKYTNTTRNFFARRGLQAEVIKLYGSMELAPLAGLADQIVDLVDTGGTLRANGLVEVETIAHVSSRLVANQASMKLKDQSIMEISERLADCLKV